MGVELGGKRMTQSPGPDSKFASGSPFQGEKRAAVKTKAFICKTRNLNETKNVWWLKGENGIFLFLFVWLVESHRVGWIEDRV